MRMLAIAFAFVACAENAPDRWYVASCGDVPPLAVAGHSIEPPQLLERVEPVWPDVVRQQNLRGAIILETALTEEGRVCAVRVAKSIESEHAAALNEAAIAAVKQWRFRPALLQGKPRKAFYAVAVTIHAPTSTNAAQ